MRSDPDDFDELDDIDDPGPGEEPDYRFTLSNERTFLAWIRTSLGLMAGGVALRQLSDPEDWGAGRTFIALLAIGASVVMAAAGYIRWRQVQAAMRVNAPLPKARVVPLVAVGMLVMAAAAFVLVATS